MPIQAGQNNQKLSFSQLVALAQSVGLSPSNANTAASVALAESGGNTANLNNNPATQDYSVGLWQINLFGNLANGRPSAGTLYTPQGNAAAMAKISSGGTNWTPWTTFTSGLSSRYMPGGSLSGSPIMSTSSTTASGYSTPSSSSSSSSSSTPSKPSLFSGVDTTGIFGGVTATLQDIFLSSGFVILGLILVGIGAFIIASPQLKKGAQIAAKGATV
jgi:Lysozyme like domain